MSQPSLKQWYEDRKRLRVVYDHSRSKPVERKNKIKKSRQAAFKSALAERTNPSGQHQDTKTNTSDSSLGKEQCGAQTNRDEASSHKSKDTHHMIQIFIKTPINPKTLCLRLDHKTTVSDLKDTIHRKLAIRPALQNLYTNNKRFKLCDALTLLDLGIKPETNIDLTLAEGLLGGAPTPVDKTLLRTLAVNLCKDWRQLAVKLKFGPAEIGKFERFAESNPEEQAYQMLVSWLSEQQADDGEAGEWLRSALAQIGRRDLAARIPGYSPTSQGAGNKGKSPDASGVDEKKLRVPGAATDLPQTSGYEPTFQRAGNKEKSPDSSGVDEKKLRVPEADRTDMPQTSGYIPTSPRAGSKSQSPEHQSISDASGINEMLGVVAENMGKDWKQLGTSLGIKIAQVDTYPIDHPNDVREQIYQMLRNWVWKQTSQKEAEEGLIETLLKLRRADIVQQLPGYASTSQGASKIDEVHCRQPKEHQSLTDTSGISEKKLGDLAEHIGKDWNQLATCLGITVAKIERYQLDYPNEINQQVFRMLLDWCRHDPEAAEDGLKEALKKISRTDIVKLLGEMELPSKAWVETLVSHYKETLKVNTHPAHKDMAVDMDQLYVKSRLPGRITELLHLAIGVFYYQKKSKDRTSSPSKKITEERFNGLIVKLGQVALERSMLKGHAQNSFAVSEFNSDDLVTFGCEVGLLTRVQFMHGIEMVQQVQFHHMIFMQFCCSVYLSGLAESNSDRFYEYMLKLLEVERNEYLIRFCSGRSKKAAECVIELIRKHLSVYNKNTPVECERYVYLHRIMMLVLFEAKLGSTVKNLAQDEWVRFPYGLKGEDLLAAHYFIQNLPERSSLHYVLDISITCQETTDLDLLEQIMARTKCDLSLEVAGVNMNDKINELKNNSKFVTRLILRDCQLSCASVPQLFQLFQSATKLQALYLLGSNLHGLKSDQIPRVPSLVLLFLDGCKLTKDDIGPLFSIVAAAGSVRKLYIVGNDLRGVKRDQITPVSSLKELHLDACGIKSDDIGSVFSIVAAAGSVTKLALKDNDLHGIQGDQITPVSSLKELELSACGIQSDDIGSVFSIVAAAGSVTRLALKDNDLHGIKGDKITPVSSLKVVILSACSIHSEDIGSVFSIVAAAGSVRILALQDNDLHGIKGDQITPVSSLDEMHLLSCGIQSDDIGPVFSIVAAAGSVTALALRGNDLHGIKGDQITPISSLKELHLYSYGIHSDDIGSVFSIVASAGSVTTLSLKDNDLHGIKVDQITPVSSLKELHLYSCDIHSDDIGSVFSIVAAAGSVNILALKDNDLHGIKGDQIHPVSSLKEWQLLSCGIQSDDIGSVFSIVAAAGSVTTLFLKDNDLHGIKEDQITPISSLKELHIYACGIQSDDIGSVFSIVAAAGSVAKLTLKDNNIHGIKGVQITPVSSLMEFYLYACGIQSDDIGSVFSIVAAAGSVRRLAVQDNDLHGIKGDQITPVSSLKELNLLSCGIQSDDIAPVFSIVAAAGSVTTLDLRDNHLHGIKGDQITPVSSLKELILDACGIQCDDIRSVFSIVAAAGSVTTLALKDNDLHGIKGDQITPVSSLKEWQLLSCGIQSDDIGSVFSIVAAAGSVTTLVLKDNNIHGIKGDQITPVSSLKELHLLSCGIQSDDIGPIFSIVAAAGSVTTLFLKDNDLHGIKGDKITPVSSLKVFHIYACGIQSDDIGSVFSIVAAAGSVTELTLKDDNIHGIKGDQITPVSSLKQFHLCACGIQSDDIGSVFSIVAAAGSVTTLVLQDNDLHGIKGDQITPVSPLKVVVLNACGLQSDDIEAVFSVVAAAGSVRTLSLQGYDLHGIKGDQITPISFLKELHLYACGIRSDDIGSVFSIVAATGSVTRLSLEDNDLHGIKGDQIIPISSLKELHLCACSIQSDDIGSVFSIVAAAGSVTTLFLQDNDLHGIKGDQITPVSSLRELRLLSCGIQSDDIGPVFSIAASAGSIERIWLNANNLHGIKGEQIVPVPSLKYLFLDGCGLQDDDLKVFSLAMQMDIHGSQLLRPTHLQLLHRFVVAQSLFIGWR
ncbi:uncharacterized protein [Asterias amurensis]|uniref:uncharacterized protein isoform X3 n=1 Tax=Asterias amurensis TaxID=7602 RepID=UPI003AB709DB